MAKYSSDGEREWAQIFGGADAEHARDIVTLSDGSVYLTGSTNSANMHGQTNWVEGSFLIKLSSDVLTGGSSVYKLLKNSQEITLRIVGAHLSDRSSIFGTSHKHLLLKRVLRCFLRRRTAASRSIPGMEH